MTFVCSPWTCYTKWWMLTCEWHRRSFLYSTSLTKLVQWMNIYSSGWCDFRTQPIPCRFFPDKFGNRLFYVCFDGLRSTCCYVAQYACGPPTHCIANVQRYNTSREMKKKPCAILHTTNINNFNVTSSVIYYTVLACSACPTCIRMCCCCCCDFGSGCVCNLCAHSNAICK